ncbi:hypothetical protein EGM51_00215 [Verrucomicrobia bacterium S94]|nr:hypothetical protein EGM51_00215 [Verrucomicrobia bacterium S94]
MNSEKCIWLFTAALTAAVISEAKVVLSDDFSTYSAGKPIGNGNWKPKWVSEISSQQGLFTAHEDGYAVLSGSAERAYHIPYQTGFIIRPGQSVTLSADFRYTYVGGGAIDEYRNSKVFGLQLSTAPNWYNGKRTDLCLSNRGEAMGFVLPSDPWVEGWIPHKTLGIDLNKETTGEWLHFECNVYDRDGELAATMTVSAEGFPAYTTKEFPLGLPVGSVVYPGFTTGWSSAKSCIREYARIAEVHMDNFSVQTDSAALQLVKAPPPKVKPARPQVSTLGLVL